MAIKLTPIVVGPASISRSRQASDTPAVAREAAVQPSEALATVKPAASGSNPCNCCKKIGT